MKTPTLRRAQRGISLIESLVALLVLALGILGLAGIQTRTLTDTRLTNARAAAIRMSSDIQERMKLNVEAQSLAPNPYLVDFGAAAAAPVDCNTAACTAAQLAAFDIAQWKATLSTALPGGDARVFASPDDTRQFGVLVSWTNNQSTAADADLADYVAPFATNTNVAGVACPANSLCHLTVIRPL
ncbi:type IV pilus modification protein PilV [Hydrogenophaga sp. PAMC20947]|uniref:type IV pilus modification protein PilV n=1 Tax=Hydrogenophaga sp. PAMC20947 TaxID=2565558 RepID=UPI001445838B|nr:type IV pilus modification protein PilV [Hydrogenophaga sp. PAMC20947]